MTRVSQEHLDARRQQILDAARRCFVRSGFHATSMQEVLAEAGLSAGAVYRYFKGKDAIIAAITAQALDDIEAAFERQGAEPLPPLERIVDLVLEPGKPPLDDTPESAQLLLQVWSEALRSPSLAERYREVLDRAEHVFSRFVEQYQEQGLVSADVPAAHVARVLIGFVHGFMVQRALDDRVDAATFRSGLHALLSPASAAAR
ncbi:TetR/AcrR family transcriptional regulator [Promicromonospora sp. NFX87]|uniref:TetR/AcrR family transcriptional regulator n=1 Tax=Promicromonospora sp. NFX87 TaxID=3402691 RepID=UPI003AFA0B83